MKILVVGSTGTIGKRVVEELSERHEVVQLSRNTEIPLDISSSESIKEMYKMVGRFDALICTAGNAHFGAFNEMEEEHFYTGIHSKMMGQINLVMLGKKHINSGGSFTLTTGILSEEPIAGSAGLAMVNGAVNAFAMVAACELENNVRINIVSPGMVEDSADKYKSVFPGFNIVPMQKVVNAYVKSLEGIITGQVIKVYE